MPYVASTGTYVPCRVAVRGAVVSSGTTHVHNVFRSTAVSALTTGEGATHGAW